ncbi:MAG: tRNA pseudouridine(38-40) synthase TruA [Candidatus Melainabacteria bacterium]
MLLLVEYNGAAYHGSQYQPGHPTIQSALMDALTARHVAHSSMMMAGRTDAGVHAAGQVYHVHVPAEYSREIQRLPALLNTILPPDIRVKAVAADPDCNVHAQRSAVAKWYRYQIYESDQPSVWKPPNALWRRPVQRKKPAPLAVDKMAAAARLIEGTHRFTSYKCANSPVKSDICRVISARIHQKPAQNGRFINFDIVSDRFLYKMVRNLMGQLLDIGTPRKNLPPETLLQVLAREDRNAAAPAARPDGLTLMAVAYPPGEQPFPNDPLVRTLTEWLNPPETPNLPPFTFHSFSDQPESPSYENVCSQAPRSGTHLVGG